MAATNPKSTYRQARRSRWSWATLHVLVLAPVLATAQQPDADIIRLEFREVPELANGQVAAVEGEVDSEGLRFALPDLSVLQPVEVRLAATDPARPVRLEVTKFGYEGVLKDGTTDAEGLAVLRFRTQMGVILNIEAIDASAPFQLLVWAGDELEAVPRNVLTPMKPDAARGGRWLPYAIAGIVLAALIAVALVLVRRRGSK